VKKIFITGVIILTLLVVVLSGCTAKTTGTTTAYITNQQTGIWVNGEGKVTVTPDIVTISLGAQSQEATVAEAQSKTAAAMEAITAVLKANNIADKDVQTQQFNISPVYSYDQPTGKQSITGYQVTNIVSVKVRDTSKAGTIIDAVAEAGGNLTLINNINFTVEKPEQYYDQARQLAIADAKQKAQDTAKLAGVTLGEPTYITESTSSPSPIYYSGGSMAVPAPTVITSISSGSEDIILNVQVAYAIVN